MEYQDLNSDQIGDLVVKCMAIMSNSPEEVALILPSTMKEGDDPERAQHRDIVNTLVTGNLRVVSARVPLTQTDCCGSSLYELLATTDMSEEIDDISLNEDNTMTIVIRDKSTKSGNCKHDKSKSDKVIH